MRGWYSVLIEGEMRVVASDDPREFVEAALEGLQAKVEDVELEIQDAQLAPNQDGDPASWIFILTMRYAERFSESEYAVAAARAAALQLETEPLLFASGINRANVVFQLSSADYEDWDKNDGSN